jgi:hypothetical protein
MNHRALVNLHDDDLNLARMVATKVYLNLGVMGDQKNQQNLDETMVDRKMGGQLMDDQMTIHQMKDDRLMDDQNYLIDLNFRDALPYTHSLITIEI